MKFSIVIASNKSNGIGLFDEESLEYKIPWKSPEDMKFFKELTSDSQVKKAVIMGRNTYNTIPNNFLKNRVNIVLTSNKNLIQNNDTIVFNNLNSALKYCESNFLDTYVIGGAKLYNEAIYHPDLEYIYWNVVTDISKTNIFFPISFEKALSIYQLDENYILPSFNLEYYKFICIQSNYDEINYLNLLKKIINYGDKRQTRNSITYSLFSEKLEFNLQYGFPLLTTKKMFLRGIFEELMWILRGQTNSKILEDKKVNIWKANTTNEFLQKSNLKYKEGDIGNMYGFQLNHSGYDYKGYDFDYTNCGFNQIEYCLNLLKNDKFSRRIIMSTFSPYSSNKGVLYPCHGIVIQFYVKELNNKNYLSCHMYQRSADMFLGVPFNIASYSLLVYMICNILNYDNEIKIKFIPDKLTMSFGDIHIYESHIESVKQQIVREPFLFPQIKLNKNIQNINNYEYNDIKIINYKHHDAIKGVMIA